MHKSRLKRNHFQNQEWTYLWYIYFLNQLHQIKDLHSNNLHPLLRSLKAMVWSSRYPWRSIRLISQPLSSSSASQKKKKKKKKKRRKRSNRCHFCRRVRLGARSASIHRLTQSCRWSGSPMRPTALAKPTVTRQKSRREMMQRRRHGFFLSTFHSSMSSSLSPLSGFLSWKLFKTVSTFSTFMFGRSL